ncbi:DNA mismatch repair protein spellchecker 1, partial [Pseudolycoriella hygida]
KPVTTVRFFDRSDYYSVHGEDSNLAAKCIFKSVSNIKTMKPDDDPGLDYLCLSKGNFEILLRDLLLVKNYRVELFTMKGRDSRANDWLLEFKGSPGNLIQFEQMLFNNNEIDVGTTLIALNVKLEDQQKNIGVASIDVNERIFSLVEFVDNDFYSELEALIVLLGPKECVLPSSDGEFQKIKTLLDRNNVMVSVTKKADFILDKSDLVQDLNKLLKFEEGQQENAKSLPEMSKTVAMSALAAATKYLHLVGDSCNFAMFQIKLLNLNRFVHLDSAAVCALNLFPPPGTPLHSSTYKWQSILGVLDRCRTPQGHRLMAQWIKQPLRNEAIIKDRHDIVQCFIDDSTARTDLHEGYLKKMPDVMVLCKKLMRKKASLQDLYRLYQAVARMPKIITVLENLVNTAVDNVLVSPLKDTLE